MCLVRGSMCVVCCSVVVDRCALSIVCHLIPCVGMCSLVCVVACCVLFVVCGVVVVCWLLLYVGVWSVLCVLAAS